MADESDLVLAINTKTTCTYCDVVIGKNYFECIDPDCHPNFKICITCYTYGAEIGLHKAYHKCLVKDIGTFPLFEKNNHFLSDKQDFFDFIEKKWGREYAENFSDQNEGKLVDKDVEEYEWRAIDEIVLIETLKKIGLGNWNEVSNQLFRNLGIMVKPNEIRKHYEKYYGNRGIIGRLVWALIFTDPEVRYLSRFPFFIERNYKFLSEFTDENLSSSLLPLNAESVGYLPKRDDYERDFDSCAEFLMSNLNHMLEIESNYEKKIKFSAFNTYKRRITSRQIAKFISSINKLVDVFFENNHWNISMDSEELSYKASDTSKIIPIVRTICLEDSNSLLQNIALEKVVQILLKQMISMYYIETCPNFPMLSFEDKFKFLNKIHKRTLEFGEKSEAVINMEKARGKSDEELIDLFVFSDVNDTDKDCFKESFKKEKMASLIRFIIDFLKKEGNERFLKQIHKTLKCDDNPNEPPTKKLLTTKSKKVSSYQDQIEHMNDVEKKFSKDCKLDPMLYSKFKDALIKAYKKLPKTSRNKSLNLDNVISRNQFDKKHKEDLKKVYDFLVSSKMLSN